jgi:hypothetical protein
MIKSVKSTAGIAHQERCWKSPEVLEMEGSTNWDSFKYLGIPIFKTTPKLVHWISLLEKMKIHIQAWGETWLNLAGKVVLLKSILTSLPIYQNSILLAPKTIVNRRFL